MCAFGGHTCSPRGGKWSVSEPGSRENILAVSSMNLIHARRKVEWREGRGGFTHVSWEGERLASRFRREGEAEKMVAIFNACERGG